MNQAFRNEMMTLGTVLEEVHRNMQACAESDSLRIDDLNSQWELLQEYEYDGPESLQHHVYYSGMDTEPREELLEIVLKHTVTK